MDNKQLKNRPGMEALLEIARIVQEQLMSEGIQSDKARDAALKAADAVRKTYGGTDVYISKGVALILNDRDWQIWHEFNGRNQDELAKRYNLTPRHIYRIVERCRDEDFLRRQGNLF